MSTVKSEKVTLAKRHRHCGIDEPAGATIDVTPGQKKWLAKNGIVTAAADKSRSGKQETGQ